MVRNKDIAIDAARVGSLVAVAFLFLLSFTEAPPNHQGEEVLTIAVGIGMALGVLYFVCEWIASRAGVDNLLLWYPRLLKDAFATDTGPCYGLWVASFVAIGCAASVFFPLLLAFAGAVTWWQSSVVGMTLYLICGVFFHLLNPYK